MTGPAGPLDLLVVGWYPAADDPIAGRFVADQAAALLATGRVRPSVVSFEPFRLHGDRQLREATGAAWARTVMVAVRDGRAFAARGAAGPAGVPVLRLGSPLGGTRTAARTHQAIHRATSLSAVLAGAPGRWPLIHVHVGFPEGAAVAIAARDAGVPYVLTEHAGYLNALLADHEIRAAYLDAARSAARIVVVSQTLATFLAIEFPELVEKLLVIPNAVDVDAFRPVAALDRDPDELLWVGYRQEAKGTSILLQAFRAVHALRPATRLRMIGRSTTEEEEAGWHRLAAQMGIADAVSIEPPADRSGIAAAMERAALFVHPSPTETFGVVAVEALAAGLPVVAADSGGVTDVLGPDPNAVGAVVPADDAARLADAILRTLARRAVFEPAALRAHVVDRFGAPSVAARLVAVYDAVLREHGGAIAAGPGSAPGAATRAASRLPVVARDRDTTAPPWSLGDGPVVLAAFDRPALDRVLGTFSAALLGPLVVATTGGPIVDLDDAVLIAANGARDVAAILALSGRARSKGLAGLVAAGPRWLLRAIRRRRLLRRGLPALTAGLVAACDLAVRRGAVRPLTVVCIGGIDILAALPLVAAGTAEIAPGGARWLADQRAG